MRKRKMALSSLLFVLITCSCSVADSNENRQEKSETETIDDMNGTNDSTSEDSSGCNVHIGPGTRYRAFGDYYDDGKTKISYDVDDENEILIFKGYINEDYAKSHPDETIYVDFYFTLVFFEPGSDHKQKQFPDYLVMTDKNGQTLNFPKCTCEDIHSFYDYDDLWFVTDQEITISYAAAPDAMKSNYKRKNLAIHDRDDYCVWMDDVTKYLPTR